MPQVASDPAIQRPLRPEPAARPGAPSGEPSGAFGDMLEASAGPSARSPRTGGARSDSTDQTKAESAPPKPSDAADATAGTDQAKLVVGAGAAQLKTSQPSDAPPVAAILAPAIDASAVAIDFVIAAQAVTAVADATPAIAKESPKKPEGADTENKPDGSTDADALVPAQTIDPNVPDTPVAVVVTTAAPIVTPPDAPANPGAGGIAVAPVELHTPPPVVPADAAPIKTPSEIAEVPRPTGAPAVADASAAADAPASAGAPAPANISARADPAGDTTPVDLQPKADGATPELAKAVASDEPQKIAFLAAGLTEQPDAQSPTRPNHKAEAGKDKSGQHAEAKIAKAAEPHSAESIRPADVPANQDAKSPAPHQPHAQAAEHSALTAHSASADARSDITTAPAAAGQLNTNPPALALNLAAPLSAPLAHLFPVALRTDPSADNAIPVAGLAVEIVSRAQDGLRRFDIRLDPPELGRIDVRLDVDAGGKVTSRLTVERIETLDLLRRDAPQLERALQHAGLNTEGGLQFSLRDQNFANREQAPRDTAPTLIIPDDEPAAAEAARRGYGRLIGLGGGIDIRV